MVLIIEKCLILYNDKEFGLLDYKFMKLNDIYICIEFLIVGC